MSETYPGQMLPELQEKTTVDSNDLFYMVSGNASKKIKGSNLKAQMKPSDYTGATSSTNGANGLVPQPTTSDIDRFLKGDGTWGDISYAVGEASGSIATFSDGSPLPMRSLKVYIEPVQDLHGYDSPWVGGSGKNKLPMVLNDIKSANTSGTWSGNTYTVGSFTFTLLVDSNDNVTGINLNGTSDGWISLTLKTNYPINANTYLLSCVGASGNKYLSISLNGQEVAVTSNNDVQVVVSENTTISSSIVIRPNSTITNVIMYPMLRLSTESDATFAPYENICPISGWDEVNVNRAKVYQICEPSDSTEVTANGVTMTYLGKGKYRVKGTPTANEYTALNIPIVPFTIYGGDDAYIKINNSVGLSNTTLVFNNGTSQIDSWGLYPSNRSGTYVGMRNKYTNNITIAISSSGYGTNFDFTFKVEILSNSTTNLSAYTIQFTDGSNPLTVYGGILDVVSGVLVVDRKTYTLTGSESWRALGTGFGEGTGLSDIGSFNQNQGIAICSHFKKNNTYDWNALTNGEFNTADKFIAIKSDSDFTTVEECVSYVTNQYNNGTPIQICGVLATPQTYQLTAQQVNSLLGENNVWADTGDVDVHYVRDLTITIDDILSRLEALEG